jgi:regulator of sigma E protease
MDILGEANFVLSVLIGLLLLVLLVVVHELGHAVVARRNGVVVEEFGIGFPPRAWAKRLKNGILFTVNWLPLGGFVKLQGEHDAADKKGDYGAASLWSKTKILLAGVFVNWLVAVAIFTLLAFVGLPKLIENQYTVKSDTTEVSKPVTIAQVVAGSPASSIGLEKGDQLVRFAGLQVNEPLDLSRYTKQYQGKSVEIIYKRGSVEHTDRVTLRQGTTKGYLGVSASQQTTYRSTWSAPIVGVALTGQYTAVTLQALGGTLGNFVTGVIGKLSPSESSQKQADQRLTDAGNNVSGPLATLGILFPSARAAGLSSLLFVTGLISLALAIMNTLPIPALDGGRWFVTMLFRVIRKPLTKDLEERIHGTGFMILMALVVLVTIADVGKFGH